MQVQIKKRIVFTKAKGPNTRERPERRTDRARYRSGPVSSFAFLVLALRVLIGPGLSATHEATKLPMDLRPFLFVFFFVGVRVIRSLLLRTEPEMR